MTVKNDCEWPLMWNDYEWCEYDCKRRLWNVIEKNDCEWRLWMTIDCERSKTVETTLVILKWWYVTCLMCWGEHSNTSIINTAIQHRHLNQTDHNTPTPKHLKPTFINTPTHQTHSHQYVIKSTPRHVMCDVVCVLMGWDRWGADIWEGETWFVSWVSTCSSYLIVHCRHLTREIHRGE